MKLSLDEQIQRQRERCRSIGERLGYLMTQRADAEDKLADLLKKQQAEAPPAYVRMRDRVRRPARAGS